MQVRWVTAFVDRGPGGFDATTEFWTTVSGSSLSGWRGNNHEFATLVPSDGADAHLRVQRTSSVPGGSHIDLHVEDVRSGTAECVQSGATVLTDRGSFVMLASPGGLAFCIVAHHGERHRQGPVVSTAGGATTLIDQVSIDCDPNRFDDEIRLWSSITDWSPLAARASDFVPLDRPPAMPLQVVLQRRARVAGRTSCHLDVACDDVEAAVVAHEALGASVVYRHISWTVMADPSGTTYCLTRRRPSTGQLAPESGQATMEEPSGG